MLEDDVVLVVAVLLPIVVVVVTTGGGKRDPQGSRDIKSLAIYRFNLADPPQICDASPVHGFLQSLSGAGTVPLPRTTPQ